MNKETIAVFEQLGLELKNSSWSPAVPVAQPFDPSERGPYLVRLAVVYMQENDARLRSALCDGQSCKVGINAGASAAATIADCLAAIGGFPIPVFNLANCLAMYGLHKFCAGGPISGPTAPVTANPTKR
jgi:hypothetical protein